MPVPLQRGWSEWCVSLYGGRVHLHDAVQLLEPVAHTIQIPCGQVNRLILLALSMMTDYEYIRIKHVLMKWSLAHTTRCLLRLTNLNDARGISLWRGTLTVHTWSHCNNGLMYVSPSYYSGDTCCVALRRTTCGHTLMSVCLCGMHRVTLNE